MIGECQAMTPKKFYNGSVVEISSDTQWHARDANSLRSVCDLFSGCLRALCELFSNINAGPIFLRTRANPTPRLFRDSAIKIPPSSDMGPIFRQEFFPRPRLARGYRGGLALRPDKLQAVFQRTSHRFILVDSCASAGSGGAAMILSSFLCRLLSEDARRTSKVLMKI